MVVISLKLGVQKYATLKWIVAIDAHILVIIVIKLIKPCIVVKKILLGNLKLDWKTFKIINYLLFF